MLDKKKIMFVMMIVFGSNQALSMTADENLSFILALAIGKLVATIQPVVDVTSTEALFIRDVGVTPLVDAQCQYVGLLEEHLCFGQNSKARIRLFPAASVKTSFCMGCDPLVDTCFPTPMKPLPFSGLDDLPVTSPLLQAVTNKIRHGAEQQRRIVGALYRQEPMFLYPVNDDCEEESPSAAKISENSSDTGADTDSSVVITHTSTDPFPVSDEIRRYFEAMMWRKIKQEAISGDEETTGTGGQTTDASNQCSTEPTSCAKVKGDLTWRKSLSGRIEYICQYDGCSYCSRQKHDMKKHQQIHLPDNQKVKIYQCCHEGCSYSSFRKDHLKKHTQTHLPKDKHAKVHQCGHDGCHYKSHRVDLLRQHERTHRLKSRLFRCRYDGCDYSCSRNSALKIHVKKHLPTDQS